MKNKVIKKKTVKKIPKKKVIPKKKAKKRARKKIKPQEEPNPVGRPLLFKSPEELQKKIQDYFDSCWDYKRDMFGNRIKDKEKAKEEGKKDKDHGYVKVQIKPYTMGSLAVALGCSRNTLVDYGDKEEFLDTIKVARDVIYAYAEDSLFIGKNQAGTIFSMKNNYGWVDKHEIDTTIIDRSINPSFKGMTDEEVLAIARRKG